VDTAATPANARSRRTRTALLSAARRILEEEGFRGLTMEAVAQRAGVTRRSVYLHYASRGDLVRGLFDYVAGAEGLQESLDRVWAAPDAESTLAEWAAHVGRYHARLIAVDRAVVVESERDPDAAEHRRRVLDAKMQGCSRVIGRLADEGRLAPEWNRRTAAEMLLHLDSSDLIAGLLGDAGWPPKRFVELYTVLLRRTFLA
jgi:AcrR family transcriptional regulator